MPSIDEIVRENVEKQLAIKENFIARYLAETGANIRDTTLVEQRIDFNKTNYWCEPKPKIPLNKSEVQLMLKNLSLLIERTQDILGDLNRLKEQLKETA